MLCYAIYPLVWPIKTLEAWRVTLFPLSPHELMPTTLWGNSIKGTILMARQHLVHVKNPLAAKKNHCWQQYGCERCNMGLTASRTPLSYCIWQSYTYTSTYTHVLTILSIECLLNTRMVVECPHCQKVGVGYSFCVEVVDIWLYWMDFFLGNECRNNKEKKSFFLV